jgi:hypothetical protein
MDAARVVTLIETTLTRRGSGKDDGDPIRVITQYWTLDGVFVMEIDPYVRVVQKPRA